MKVLNNGAAVIDGDTHHAIWVEQEGLVHDLFTANIIRKAFTRYQVTCAIDAGANIGTLTRVMLDAGARVHAFECNPAAAECLRHNCPEAHVYEVALSDKPGELAFVPDANAGASYTLDHSPLDPRATSETSYAIVHSMALDSYLIQPGFIKLDIEGFEVRALEGARRIIARHRPVILCEVNQGALMRADTSDELLRSLLQDFFGYQLKIVQPDCQWGDPQFDILCTPKG